MTQASVFVNYLYKESKLLVNPTNIITDIRTIRVN